MVSWHLRPWRTCLSVEEGKHSIDINNGKLSALIVHDNCLWLASKCELCRKLDVWKSEFQDSSRLSSHNKSIITCRDGANGIIIELSPWLPSLDVIHVLVIRYLINEEGILFSSFLLLLTLDRDR